MLKMSMSLAQNADDGYETSLVESLSAASAESPVLEFLCDAESAIPDVPASAASIGSNNSSTSPPTARTADDTFVREDPW
jgi:hypothetical protein